MRARAGLPRAAIAGLLVALVVATGCGGATVQGARAGRLSVVATTTIVGDVVRQVGGDVDVAVLLPVGADPHAFEPTPHDIARMARARVIFANGAGLESFLGSLLRSAGGQVEVVEVAEGVGLRRFGEREAEAGESEQPAQPPGEGHDESVDPHVWMDPNNAIVWTRNIEAALSRLDPANAGRYRANAEAYRGKLEALDAWIREQIGQIPEGNRRLVTDHVVFGYLADRYGLEQVGAVFPGYSTLAEPSARELATLEDAIRRQGVRAVFVGNTVNPSLAQRVAADTGTRLVQLYTGSLSGPGGPASTYLDLMRYDVAAIVEALR